MDRLTERSHAPGWRFENPAVQQLVRPSPNVRIVVPPLWVGMGIRSLAFLDRVFAGRPWFLRDLEKVGNIWRVFSRREWDGQVCTGLTQTFG
jgi:hypothetical protein